MASVALNDTQIAFITPSKTVHRVSETTTIDKSSGAIDIQLHKDKLYVLFDDGRYEVDGTLLNTNVQAACGELLITKDGSVVGAPQPKIDAKSMTGISASSNTNFWVMDNGFQAVVWGDRFEKVFHNTTRAFFVENRLVMLTADRTVVVYETSTYDGFHETPYLTVPNVATFDATPGYLWTVTLLSNELQVRENFTSTPKTLPMQPGHELFANGDLLCMRSNDYLKVITAWGTPRWTATIL